MKTAYIAISLSHVPECDRDEIRAFIAWFEKRFKVRLLMWAFDLDTWTPKPVDNIYRFDTKLVLEADLAVFMYIVNGGSDGRGGELVTRALSGKPLVAFIHEGVKVNRYVKGCIESCGSALVQFKEFEDIAPCIEAALEKIDNAAVKS